MSVFKYVLFSFVMATPVVDALPYKTPNPESSPLLLQLVSQPSDKQRQQSIVYLNTATAEQLSSLKGVGLKKAQAIVDYRKRHGRFKVLQDLLKVKGIGPAILRNNKDRLRL